MILEQMGEMVCESSFQFPIPSLTLSQVDTFEPTQGLDPKVLNASDIFNDTPQALLDEQVLQLKMQEFKMSDDAFMMVDMNLSQIEMRVLNNIDIIKTAEYDCYGNLQAIEAELPHFLNEVTTANEEEILILTHLVENIADHVVHGMDSETAWISVRTYTENHDFDVHRWHFDGYFYSHHDEIQVKFAVTLKGDPTLFYPLPDSMRAEFSHLRNALEYWDKTLDENLIITPLVGQGVVFVLGDPLRGAIHSEPMITQDRLFLVVLPGSQAQIAELKVNWTFYLNYKKKSTSSF